MSDQGSKWGINNDYAPLTDVLLGVPEYYRWVDAGPLIARTLNNALMKCCTGTSLRVTVLR